ncbi:uncharacterized protein LOC120073358 [Benincasa hispida]|uniref:uncharacterized protein LOC120073358 n=1 Tax=Benincasa hispida TaxID=102211 RepID=UPI001901C681|nr:uncharacterized protein LOC120073358 [Benincasa hispida]
MAVSLSRFSLWFWNGKEKETVANGSPPNSSSEFGNGLREPESLKFKRVDLPSSSKKVNKQKWQSKKETTIEWEYDFVMVPSSGDDDMQMADSGDEADWSIGWLEPHGPGFQSDDSFAVLVPSYSNRCKEVVEGSNVELLAAIKKLQNEFSPESKKYMELWLSLLQNSIA